MRIIKFIILIASTLFVSGSLSYYITYQTMHHFGPDWCDETEEHYISKQEAIKDLNQHKEDFIRLVGLLDQRDIVLFLHDDQTITVFLNEEVPLDDFDGFTKEEKHQIQSFLHKRNSLVFRVDSIDYVDSDISFKYWSNVIIVYQNGEFEVRELICPL